LLLSPQDVTGEAESRIQTFEQEKVSLIADRKVLRSHAKMLERQVEQLTKDLEAAMASPVATAPSSQEIEALQGRIGESEMSRH